MIDTLEVEFDSAPPKGRTRLRDYQLKCTEAIRAAWMDFTRIMVTLPTGTGKTVVFSDVTREEVDAGGRVLILAHTDELLEQAIDKLEHTTGLHAEKEKAGERASLEAKVVVASIATLSRQNRLTSFPDNHFTLVIVDETHRVLAPGYQRVMKYFHFGAQSLEEGWQMPEVGVAYQHKARNLGVTATGDRSDTRSLGEWYQSCVFEYDLLSAVADGNLVRPVVRNIPLKIDVRGVKKTAGDYDAAQVSERLAPIIKEIAKHLAIEGRDRKTVVFTPSVETARMLAKALNELGADADFVSGACPDRAEKLEAFHAKGNGSFICNAMMLTEGWDHPEVSAVCVLRLTKSRGLYVQCCGRGLRTLTGTIDGLETREERLAAIAASDKKDCIIFDFFWHVDKMDIMQPVDLVTSKPEVRERMLKSGEPDLVVASEKAERDFVKAMERAAKRNANKAARTVDPIAWAVSIGDAALAHWEPETAADARPITVGQADFLRKQHIDPANIKYQGLASKIINRTLMRMRLKLATAIQLNFLSNLGYDEQECATLSFKEASALIDRTIAERRARAG